MANGAWFWKLGLWGLVILFGFLYLGSVEWHRGDADRDPSVQSAPAAGSEAAVDNVEPDVARPVAELEESTATAVETTAAIEPAVLGGSGAPVSASPETVAGDAVEHADGGPVSSAVSQAEAHAFAQAVLSGDGAEPGRPAVPVAAGESPGSAAASEPIPETVTEATIARTPAPSVAQLAVPSAASEPTPRFVEPAVEPVAAPSAASMPTPVGSAADATAIPARETAAQRRARTMAEYRAMQQAAREEMRRRWSRPGGSFPYGAYPQWGYPQGYPPRWGRPPAFRPGD